MFDKGPCLSRLIWPLLIWAAVAAAYFELARHDLRHQDFDGDELITSYAVHRGSVAEVVQHRFRAGHPPLYFVTARIWVGQFGRSGYALHCLSVAIGALTLLAIAGLARELGLGRWSEPTAFLWALHPVLQFDARYARPAIGVSLGTILALWLTCIGLRRGGRRPWIALLILGLLGSLWSPLFILVWFSLAVGVALIPQWRRNRTFWLVLAAFGLAHATVLSYTALVASRDPFMWIQDPEGMGWVATLLDGIGGYIAGVPPRLACHPSMVVPLCIVASVIVGIVALVRRGLTPDPWLLVAATVIVPATALAAATSLGKPLFLPRYLVPMVPAAFLFLIRALAAMNPPRIGFVCAAAVALAMIAGYPSNVERHRSGTREAVRELESRLDRNRDLVVPVNWMTREMARIFSRHKINNIILPPSDINASAQWIESELGRPPRIWVISLNSRNVTNTAEWTKYAGEPFYNMLFGKVRLRGYNLKPATNDAVTTAPAAQTATAK